MADQSRKSDSELENVKQELYDAKRQIKTNDALLMECHAEIELLKNSEKIQKEKYQAKVAEVEQTIQHIRASHEEIEAHLGAQLIKKQEEIESLKFELDLAQKVSSNPHNVSNSHAEDYLFLQDENDALKDSLEELKGSMEVIQQECRDLQHTVDQYKYETDQLREALDIKREELAENSEVIEKLNGDLACAKKELATMKNKPLDQKSQGNSLFAEVDDRRVHLQQTINTMKSDYMRIQQESAYQEKAISELRKQNAELRDKFQKDVEQIEEDRLLIKTSFKGRIRTLEQLVEKLRKELEDKPIHIPSDDLRLEFQYYKFEMKSYEEEIRKLERKIDSTSLYETGMAMELAQARREIRKWNNQAIKLAHELEDLKRTAATVSKDSVVQKPNRSSATSTVVSENVAVRPKPGFKSVGFAEPDLAKGRRTSVYLVQ